MALWIQISPGSDEPIYAQIASQISEAIAKGRVGVGDKLPPVRKLAAELVINPNTVAHAYTVLEQAGLVTTKTGAGTFVADPKLRSADAADMSVLTERMDTMIARGLNLGLGPQQLLGLFRQRLEGFADRQKARTNND